MQLVCISNGPLPYHTPILNCVNELVELHVVYMSTGHPLHSFGDLWGTDPEFDYSTYWSKAVRRPSADFRTQISFGVARRLRVLNPEVVLFSSWGPLVWEPLLWKTFFHRKAVMWSESTSFSGLLRGRLSNIARRTILSKVDSFVTNGSLATAYLESLGVAPGKVVTSCLPSPQIASRPPDRDGSPDRPRYLFVGRLIPRKRPIELLESFDKVLGEIPHATLTIVGEGLLAEELARAARRFGKSISIVGRREGSTLDEIYARSDVLVLPAAREVWGLVVNEALGHGLFVVASDQVGSALDLLDESTGIVVPCGDGRALAEAMIEAGRTAAFDSGARAIRARSVAQVTPAAFARDIVRAAQLALGHKSGSET